MVQHIKNTQLARHAITAVLLFGFACAASGGEKMTQARPAPAVVQPKVVAPVVMQPAAVMVAPLAPANLAIQEVSPTISRLTWNYPDGNLQRKLTAIEWSLCMGAGDNCPLKTTAGPPQINVDDKSLGTFLGFPFEKVTNGSVVAGVKMCYINALGSGCARIDVPKPAPVAVIQGVLPVAKAPTPGVGVMQKGVPSGPGAASVAALNSGAINTAGPQPLPAPIPTPMPIHPTVVARLPQTKQASPSQGGGMAQLIPAAACASNNTPRISNINGTQSVIVFKPGDSLNIVGCGFGKGGKVQLSSAGYIVPLIVNAWDDPKILARIDPALSHVPDLTGVVSLSVQPNGASMIFSKGSSYSFVAAREDAVVALDPKLGIYSDIYGAAKQIATSAFIRVSRHLNQDSSVSWYCPKVTDQVSQMWDFFPVKPLATGFEPIVTYTNETDQTNWDTQKVQWVLVGNGGSAKYDPVNKGIKVTFQGNSVYTKKNLLDGGYSTCTSSYKVSLKARGPRGMPPTSELVLVQ